MHNYKLTLAEFKITFVFFKLNKLKKFEKNSLISD